MSMMIKEGGWFALLAAGLGALGVLVGIIALAVLPLSRKGGHAVGVVTLVLAFLAPTFGLVGMMMGKRSTESLVSACSGTSPT